MPGNAEIQNLRPPRNKLDPNLPYYFLHEQEPDGDGNLKTVNTIFLTAKECAFKCLMCDLWKNTLEGPTPRGAILRQIDYALERLPRADVVKLYNNGNFFDRKSVPAGDHPAILERLKGFERVIVENHPQLCGNDCLDFAERLGSTFEIAMGLETIHPDILPRLNKQLTAEDFQRAAAFLRAAGIDVRAFVLLNPPYLTDEAESIEWALRTVRFAFDSGSQCCSVIATRPGNGIMEALAGRGEYVAPSLTALEQVAEKALSLKAGRVFADTWGLEFLSAGTPRFAARKERLEQMNLTQHILPPITVY